MAKKSNKLINTLKWYSPTNRKTRYYFNKDGTPKTIVRTGGSSGGGGLSGGGGRNPSQLKNYYKYYTGDGTVWAAINSMALNTVMTGYTIHSNDDKAKKVITNFCRNTDIESYMTYAMIYALVFGDSFVELVYRKDGKHLSRFKLFDPVTMNVNYDNYGDVINYQQEVGGQKQKPLDPKFVFHLNVFPKSDSPYGISLIEPSKDTIMRKVNTDTAIANAIIKHGTSKYVATIGTEKEKQLPPKRVMDKIKADLEDISGQNEFVIPWNVKIDTIDEKGVQGVEEYFNYFQTQAITGLMCPEEALGLGKGPLHPDTEIFVKDKGFLKITEVNEGDEILTYNQNTGEMEFQVNKKNWTYPVNEELYHFKGQTYDLITTDDHRMFYRGQHKDNFDVTTAGKLPTRFEMMVGGFKWTGVDKDYEIIPEMEVLVGDRWHEGVTHQVAIQEEKRIPMDIWLEFLGYFISEGYTTINEDGYTVGIRQYPGNDYNKMKDCISKLPFKVNIYEDRLTIHSKQLSKYLEPLGKSYNKYIPEHIKSLPSDKLEILYNALMVGDGCQNNYFTSSKQLANDVQEIILKMGYGSTIYERDRIGQDVIIHGKRTGKCNYIQYTVTKNEKNLTPEVCIKDTKGHKSTLHKEHYKGLVHCVTVDNGLIIARYNGKVSVTGNSTEACNDKETEVLTKRGWKHYWELNNDDYFATYNPTTEKYEWHQAYDSVDKFVYDHDGEMIRFKGRKMDMLVTPNHRIWANKNPTTTKENWKFYEAQEIYNSNSKWAIKSKSTFNDEDDNLDEEIINKMKFIGYFVSEGSINKDEPYCRLSQKKEPSAQRMKEVIYYFDERFKESHTEEKGYEWHLYDVGLYKWLKQFGNNCYDRHISREILNMKPSYLKHLLFAAIDGDGTYDKRHGRKNCEYATTSEQLADDILEIAVKCGYRASKMFSPDNRENRKGMWRVRIDLSDRDYVVISPKENCTKEYYKDKVYSLNVPNHIYVTRRNGRVAIQGNTALVKATLYERTIKSFQIRLARQIEKQIFSRVLESEGINPDDVYVTLKFKSVTEQDETQRAKWVANLLDAFKNTDKKPLTINEVRSMFDKEPIDEPWADSLDWSLKSNKEDKDDKGS
jgi:hypothetical protein